MTKPIHCSLSSEGIEILMLDGTEFVARQVKQPDFKYAEEQIIAWFYEMTGDRIAPI